MSPAAGGVGGGGRTAEVELRQGRVLAQHGGQRPGPLLPEVSPWSREAQDEHE